ncbi:MAG: hypothetical protein EBZ74_09180 [Planctomycetia bacterium]|nr:hypothetical protein [Planctomycetia bacterium]
MIIPDCTVVTMFFDLTRFYEHSRDVKTALASSKGLLNTPCYLVIFADSVMMPIIRNERKQFDNITYYVLMEVEDLPKYNKTQRVRENREKYHPTKDTRTCPENHIMQCSKVDLLLKAMDMDIFRTHMFAWVDGCTGENFYKIGRPGTSRMLLEAINRKDPSKFYLQVLNVTDKRFKDPKQKREYYAQYQWVVCGCFMVMGKEIGQKICHRVNEIFEETLNAGYGHGDEMLFLEILDEFYDHIVKSYGDYHHILPNFYSTQEGFHYIFNHIIKKYNNFGYYREAYDCCERIIQDIENNPAVPEDYESWWMQMLFQQYLAAYYYKPESAYGIVSKIRDLCHIRPKFRQEYERLGGLYDSQLPFIDYLKPKYDLIFCIFGCIGVEKYRKEIVSIVQTWGKTVEDVKEKKVLILFFLKPSGDMSLFQDSKYIHFIYLDDIFDDYLSAADKQYKGLKYIYEHYHASWIYVCGTDTFVHVQRLLDKLDKYDPEKPYFIGGNDCVRKVSSHTIPFHSGGPGFVFSHVVLKQIYPQLMTFQSSWSILCREAKREYLISACDVSFAFLIQSFSIFETLSSCFFNSNFRGNAYNNSWKLNEPLSIYSPDMLACHHMTPHDFSELYSLLFL